MKVRSLSENNPHSHSAIHADSLELRIGFAGKLIAIKGVDELLEASALLPCSENWSVTLVGDGRSVASCKPWRPVWASMTEFPSRDLPTSVRSAGCWLDSMLLWC